MLKDGFVAPIIWNSPLCIIRVRLSRIAAYFSDFQRILTIFQRFLCVFYRIYLVLFSFFQIIHKSRLLWVSQISLRRGGGKLAHTGWNQIHPGKWQKCSEKCLNIFVMQKIMFRWGKAPPKNVERDIYEYVDRKNKNTLLTTNLLQSLKWGKLTIIRPNYNSLKSFF